MIPPEKLWYTRWEKLLFLTKKFERIWLRRKDWLKIYSQIIGDNARYGIATEKHLIWICSSKRFAAFEWGQSICVMKR